MQDVFPLSGFVRQVYASNQCTLTPPDRPNDPQTGNLLVYPQKINACMWTQFFLS